MRCNYYIQSKKRYCRFISHHTQICVFHNNFLKKNNKLGLYKIGQLIKKNKYHFFTYMYYKKILRNFFRKYCFPHKFPECSICLEPIFGNEYSLKCNHIFHQRCLLNYLRINQFKKKCPYCRQDVLFKDAYFLQFEKHFIIRIPKIISEVYFNEESNLKTLYKNEFLDYIVNNFYYEVIIYLR